MIEEGVFDYLAAAAPATAAAAAGGSSVLDSRPGGDMDISSSDGEASAAALVGAGGGGGGEAGTAGGGVGRSGDISEEEVAATLVVLVAAARLMLVCYEGLLALQPAQQLPVPSSSSGSAGTTGSDDRRLYPDSRSASKGGKPGTLMSGRVGKEDADVRFLEVSGAFDVKTGDQYLLIRLLGLGCYCLMKRLQTAGTLDTTAAAAGEAGVSRSAQSASPPSSSAAAAAAAEAAVGAAPAEQSSRKGQTKVAAPKWSGVVIPHLPNSAVEALEQFESAEGLGFLQNVCAQLIRAYSAGVQRYGVGFKGPLGDWEIFPGGYTGALLCNEAQLCTVLLAKAPHRVACNYPGCDKMEGHSEASVVKKCTGCGVAGYCSRACQTEHWQEHKKTCKRLQKEQEEAAASGLQL
jgi:hypothetical protein